MEKLIAELTRLYLPAGTPGPQVQAGSCGPVDLATPAGFTRAVAIPFRKRQGEFEQHWQRLCDVANLVQAEFEFPAPAVSVCSTGGFVLWLSLAAPVPVAETRRFVARLGEVHLADVAPRLDALADPVELPPCLNRDNGKWSAFIHPGMGASFADESGLDMPPPAAGQLAFLDGLESIGMAQWRAALDKLGGAASAIEPVSVAAAPVHPLASAAVPTVPTVPVAGTAAPEGLLLKDATLADIVRFLHAQNIEPTFRYVLPAK
jgi:hypothetical protein